ncbi:hypothetical protein ATY35_20115 [Vibrio cidicii]|uniref:Imm33-like domain-containing protein n=1 Tax=Vibrio cidicii TaxID=1763883 RepID=A0A151KSP3_9VIBR|nr:hypothetical protein [Vibrio cidicii]EJN6830023.1 hypothetical protein [Vibrio cidicii]KYN80446.1 hypothetical protein ATY37_08160 [Vibrio cidicii]KYN80657.1 hypothetical protein ATY35_20115 [Vibrio cidicii]MBG0761813.1 hypothetical protein [Vibrio cidicii]
MKTYSQENGIRPQFPEALSKLGIAISTIGQQPINGLRHRAEKGTNGWYIWCGQELLHEDEFFSPLHIEHIDEYLPQIKKYLDLPPGYRFLIDSNGYEDVWYDSNLINVDT